MRRQLSLLFMVLAPTVQIASLGMADSLILMVMALVVFGPRRLPQIGRQIGKLMYEFRKASNDFKFQMEEELRNAEEADRRKKEEERLRALALAAPPVAVPALPADTTAGSETAKTDSPIDTLHPVAGYDNGPIASTQIANTESADTAPAITPPSIGETVSAARSWSQKYEQSKAAEVERVVEPGTEYIPPKASAPAPAESTAASTDVASSASPQASPSESGQAEPAQIPTPQPAGIAVNHHG